MLYGFPTLVFLTMFWQVSALQLTFLVASLIMQVQGILLRRPGVRKFFGLTPLIRSGATNPMASMWNASNSTAKVAKPKAKAATRQQLVREQAARRMRNLSEKDSRY
jgi:hypothetical protein